MVTEEQATQAVGLVALAAAAVAPMEALRHRAVPLPTATQAVDSLTLVLLLVAVAVALGERVLLEPAVLAPAREVLEVQARPASLVSPLQLLLVLAVVEAAVPSSPSTPTVALVEAAGAALRLLVTLVCKETVVCPTRVQAAAGQTLRTPCLATTAPRAL